MHSKMNKKIAMIVALLAARIQEASAFYTVAPTGFCSIRFSWGVMENTCDEGGKWVNPFTDVIEKFQYSLNIDTRRGVVCVGSDRMSVGFEATEVHNRIDKNKLVTAVKLYGKSYDETQILDRLPNIMRHWCANRTVDQIHREFPEFDDYIHAELQAQVDVLGLNITIERIVITPPIFDKQIQEQMAKMRSEQDQFFLLQRQQATEALRRQTEANNTQAVSARNLAKTRAEEEEQTIKKRHEAERNLMEATNAAEIKIKEAKAAAEVNDIETRARVDRAQKLLAVEVQANQEQERHEAALHNITGYTESRNFLALMNGTKTFFGPSIPNTAIGMLPIAPPVV